VIEKHEAFLRKVVPPEKLFFYRVSDGWGPLCDMLRVPVPKEPFPHNNRPEDVKMVGRMIVLVGSLAWAALLGGACVVAWYAWTLWTKFSIEAVTKWMGGGVDCGLASLDL
jgi:hypothetical protein